MRSSSCSITYSSSCIIEVCCLISVIALAAARLNCSLWQEEELGTLQGLERGQKEEGCRSFCRLLRVPRLCPRGQGLRVRKLQTSFP